MFRCSGVPVVRACRVHPLVVDLMYLSRTSGLDREMRLAPKRRPNVRAVVGQAAARAGARSSALAWTDTRDEGAQRFGDRLQQFGIHRHVADALEEDARVHQSGGECFLRKLPVTFAICGELRQDDVVRF